MMHWNSLFQDITIDYINSAAPELAELTECLRQVSIFYSNSDEYRKAAKLAADKVTKLASAESPNKACYRAALGILGFFYFSGVGLNVDKKLAFELIQKGSNLGDPGSKLFLAEYYTEGVDGIEKDQKKAFDIFQDLVTQGYDFALFKLGCCFYEGKGCEKNSKLGLEYFQTSLKKGFIHPKILLGVFYLDGISSLVVRDQKKAFEIFQELATLRHPNALHAIAVILTEGLGCSKDLEKASEFYLLAIEYGCKDVALFENFERCIRSYLTNIKEISDKLFDKCKQVVTVDTLGIALGAHLLLVKYYEKHPEITHSLYLARDHNCRYYEELRKKKATIEENDALKNISNIKLDAFKNNLDGIDYELERYTSMEFHLAAFKTFAAEYNVSKGADESFGEGVLKIISEYSAEKLKTIDIIKTSRVRV